ncbi:MAG: NHL repeat containing protein [Parcubacteria group bacterium GW2011_GWA2_44_12]|nr:MAG: NHL repeat containing protein [Parcubacteria group bacterium GW2011_GWA2_44_12]
MGNDFYPVNFQIATTDVLADPPENTLWNFIGPNGTDQTYYTSYESSLIPFIEYQSKRYLRYKVFLSTADTTKTPTVDDVSIIYSSSCIGPGQAFFGNMTAENYDIEVTHPEYVANTVSNIQISGQTIQDIKIVKPEPEAPLAGDIIVNVVNSSNSPINDATVTVFQGDLNDPDNPNVVSKQTGTNGDAQFHLAPGTYDARATSDQYSTDRTYTLGDPALQGGTPINPSPTIADNETVVVNLMIDSLGSLTLNQKTYASCAENTGTLNFTLRSKKIIATLADGGTVPKFEQTLANATSPTVISNLEWGEYEVALAGTSYSLAGIMPNSIFLSPSETADATLILDTYSSNNLLLTLSNPENRDTDIAKITVSGGALTTQKYAGHGAIFQTDWSGGGWQQTVGDPKMYFVRSLDIFGQPNIKKDTPSGQISLKQSINGNYPVPGYLYSSTFDTGINGPIEYTNLLWSQQSGSPGGTFFSIATTSNVNNEITIGGSISSASLAAPSRVTEKNGKLFIADTSNNRVLIFNSIPTRDSKDADVVLGQPDYILGKPNFISGIENNGGLSASSLFKPNGVFSDGTKLYIADTGNNRVLIYNSIPTTSNKSADIVLGQQNFTSNGINGGAGAGSSSANSLNQPDNIFVSDARLFIADTGNHRVLIHDFNLAPLISNRNADIVIGQPNFNSTSNTAGIGRKGLNSPTSVASEGTKLFVADNGNHRVLVYDPIPIQSHPQAEFVLGQVDFNGNQANQGSVPTVSRLSYPRDIHAIGSKLFIADTDNNRVLIHNFDISSLATNRNADVVIGQPDFISNLEPSTPSAFVLKQPNGVFSDGTNLFILDKGFNRALVFNQIPLSNQASANIVIGQPDMSRDESNSANAMWYYHGPQNNPGGFYSTVDPINPLHDNQRYLRYGVQFSAQSTVVPYPIEDITILYKTQCSTPNQAYFGNLSNNTVYTVNVSNIPGVTALQKDINVSGQTSATINISSLTE